ncbi:MAG TPA: 4'-phosphopantetheinyl transferase superfamily protein [Candidatus Binatia bacterium]|jgi:4'-phosphopantetheinyl transferase
MQDPIISNWLPAPVEPIEASASDVHLWRVPIDVEASYVDCLHRLLSHDEKERASRYHFERDRGRFIAARGVLRILIGRYLSTAPDKLSFEYGPNGKPFLSGFKTDLHFNVSHSHGLALIGFSLGHRIGVDVESVDHSLDVESIASRFFSDQEVSALMALPPDQRRKAFFACWTRKEAYIKARGEGLSFSLKDFSVSVAPSDAPALLNVRQEPGETARWRYLPIDAGSSYAAAAAVESEVSPRTRYWQFRHENLSNNLNCVGA